MPMIYLLKRSLLKSVLLLLVMVIVITLSPLAIDHANLANDQDSVSNESILYFPAVNLGKDWQTNVSITNVRKAVK